ncbi:MAG: hypothetical protein WCG15_01510 [Actinomycetes bacterium]
MAFDPDKYLAQTAPAFNPDAYLGIKDTRGNIINTDVPTVAGQVPNPPMVQPRRTGADYAKALYQVPATLASGAALTIPSAVSALVTKEPPLAMAQRNMYQPTSPVAQEALGAIGGALEATKLPPVIPNVGMIPSYARMAGATQPAIAEATQTVRPAVTQMAQALRKQPSIVETAPTTEALAQRSSELFNVAKQSGVELNAKDFATNMASIAKDLRNEGYDPRLYPKLAVAVEELTNAQIPKDFNELSTLRKFIQNAQRSTEPQERKLATTLKEDFDAYVSTIPESSIVGGDKQGLTAWKEARDTYSKLSKSEIFTNMLERAELDKSKFTQSGTENSLATQLRNLAKNDKQMRLFTKAEQEAIKEAAKGGTMQNLLKFYGRFTPSGPVSGIFAGGAIMANPAVGIPLELGAIAARSKATKMRKESVEKLAALMRAGKQEVTGE